MFIHSWPLTIVLTIHPPHPPPQSRTEESCPRHRFRDTLLCSIAFVSENQILWSQGGYLSLSRRREGIFMRHLYTTPLKIQLSISKPCVRVRDTGFDTRCSVALRSCPRIKSYGVRLQKICACCRGWHWYTEHPTYAI